MFTEKSRLSGNLASGGVAPYLGTVPTRPVQLLSAALSFLAFGCAPDTLDLEQRLSSVVGVQWVLIGDGAGSAAGLVAGPSGLDWTAHRAVVVDPASGRILLDRGVAPRLYRVVGHEGASAIFHGLVDGRYRVSWLAGSELVREALTVIPGDAARYSDGDVYVASSNFHESYLERVTAEGAAWRAEFRVAGSSENPFVGTGAAVNLSASVAILAGRSNVGFRYGSATHGNAGEWLMGLDRATGTERWFQPLGDAHVLQVERMASGGFEALVIIPAQDSITVGGSVLSGHADRGTATLAVISGGDDGSGLEGRIVATVDGNVSAARRKGDGFVLVSSRTPFFDGHIVWLDASGETVADRALESTGWKGDGEHLHIDHIELADDRSVFVSGTRQQSIGALRALEVKNRPVTPFLVRLSPQ